MKLYEEPLRSELLYDGKIVKLHRDTVRLENGREVPREVIRHPGGVAILAVDEHDEVLFVHQYRYPVGKVLLELPAGKLEPGEDPAACGLRELEEETGYCTDQLHFLAKVLPSPGYLDEDLYLYYTESLRFKAQNLDPDEFLTVEKLPLTTALERCMTGEIEDGKTLVALLKYDRLRRERSVP